MEKIYYDLHLHSCLSPCGDDDMTPNNIVNMALLKGLDLIALTDHNSCGNVRAVKAAARRAAEGLDDRLAGRSLLVLAGFELETAEEAHVLCLFAREEEAEAFACAVEPYYLDVANRVDIYGNQWLMNENDDVIGQEPRLLATASTISFQELFWLTDRMGGAFVPAHIDKPVYSVLSNMGFLPDDLPIHTVEVTAAGRQRGFLSEHSEIKNRFYVITSSDAHYLEDIAEPEYYMELHERTESAAIRCLKCGNALF